MTPEQLLALLQLLADLRAQLGQALAQSQALATENADLRQRLDLPPEPSPAAV